MSKSAKEAETFEFKAEVRQLLDILVHSVYTSKDIFIRELISNAADALEKARFAQVEGREIHSPEAALEIRIDTKNTEDEKILSISDTGIGMTHDEICTNIGTIAHSGASLFLEQLKDSEKKDLSLIGRFGVGFYSVFMAAEKVVITSRGASPTAEAVMWQSDGLGSYTVETAAADAPRGTRVEVHLKEGEERFAEEQTVKEAILRYSNFVPFPIVLNKKRVNETTALWREPPTQVKDEQYNEFFKFLTHDTQDAALRLHLSVDAPLQFSALLFVPKTNPEILGFGEREVSIQLYVKRVLIDSENKDLLPAYLRFARGVVESEDLPLNISRETLQENALVRKIRDTLTRKLLDLFLERAEKAPEEYNEFWKSFGRILKEGHADFANREKFQELLRFDSSRHSEEGELSALKDYVERMPDEQKAIYYLSGPSRQALELDPRLEIFRKKEVEVLYLYELADEFVLGGLGKYREKPVVSADQVLPADLGSISAKEKAGDEATKDRPEKDEGDGAVVDAVIRRFREILGERVKDVRRSERLVDSPACLVSDEEGLSGHMDKMMRLIHKDAELPKHVLELNPQHSLIRDLGRLLEADADDPFIERACEQIFEGSLLVDGYLTDPHQLVQRMNTVLADAARLKVDTGKTT
ncbi:MAG: molecular chaperone HtpG [Planctomycetota bacterium]|nr:molecular chaperone HtpG [Planctomycetota bacterium]